MDELTVIREVMADVPAASPGSTDRARAQLLELTRTPAANRQEPRRVRPALRRRGWSLAGAGLAVVAAVILVSSILGRPAAVMSPEGPAAISPREVPAALDDRAPAAVVLQFAARNAQSDVPLTLAPGQCLYQRSRGAALKLIGHGQGPFARIMSEGLGEMWFDPDGLRPLHTRSSLETRRTPLTEQDAVEARRQGYDLSAPPKVREDAMDNEAPRDPQDPRVDASPSVAGPTAHYLAGLPTDPAKLLLVIRQTTGDQNKHSPDRQVFDMIIHLIHGPWYPIIPSTLRAALYQALALIPGVGRTEGQVGFDGQQDIVIGMDGDAVSNSTTVRDEIVFDPTASRVIGFRTIQIRTSDGIPAGTVVEWHVLTYAAVNAVGQTG